jgi:uncharacterized membrane protein
MSEIVLVLTRWLHIASVAVLVGGMLYARVAMFPALKVLPSEERMEVFSRAARRYGRIAVAAILGLLLSGTYTILAFPGRSPRYHMVLGIKILLALHVFAVAVILASGRARRPARALTGAVITGLIIIAISAWLRRIF